MARFLTLCTWLLLLGPGLLATVRAECSQDCATCSYRLVRPADINFLDCGGGEEEGCSFQNFPYCFLCSCCYHLLLFSLL
ncbi:PENK isoform 7 [Pan troglodytes]|uniref:Proenkephalin-A n=2 Tax=Pan troglodytes TaxID=9598 RepID=A0A6D2XBB8_PANTR|nr:PENK isoform 7 [Pan troglodytes]